MTSLEILKKTLNDLFNWSEKTQQPNNPQTVIEKPSSDRQKNQIKQTKRSQSPGPTTQNLDNQNTKSQRKSQQSNKNVLTFLKSILIEEQVACPICLTNYKKPGLVQMCTCKHIYCGPCLRQYIDSKIAKFTLPKCPQEQCNSIINKQTSFFKSLNLKTKSLVTKIEKFYYTSNDPYLKMCPSQNCEGIVPFIEGQPFKCDKCHNQFCKKCMYFKHQGKCAKNQAIYLNLKYNFRKCNKCNIIVEKSQACDHITCKCGYEFCYGCGRKWAGSHHCPPPKSINAMNTQPTTNNQSSDSIVKKLFKFVGKVMMTVVLFCGVAIYACLCVLPMMLVTLLIGVLLGIFVYSFKFMHDTYKKQSLGLTMLLLIFFPIAGGFGIVLAFKSFWGQGFLFWWEVLRQAIQRPLSLIWN